MIPSCSCLCIVAVQKCFDWYMEMEDLMGGSPVIQNDAVANSQTNIRGPQSWRSSQLAVRRNAAAAREDSRRPAQGQKTGGKSAGADDIT